MCGIVGYTGGHQAQPILVSGLRRLEYRGYDSAGLGHDRRRSAVRAQVRWTSQVPRGAARSRARCQAPAESAIPAGRRTAPPPIATPIPTSADARVPPLAAVVHNGVIENHARPPPRSPVAGLRLRERNGYRGRRAPDRTRAGIRLRPVRRSPARLASPRGHLRSGGPEPRSARSHRRREVRQPARRRFRRGRALARQRCRGHRTLYRAGRLLAGRRGRSADCPRFRDPPPRAWADHAPDRPHRLEARRGRAARARALHDQGDPRAARNRHRCLPRPPSKG